MGRTLGQMFIEVLLALNTQNPAPIERKNRYRVLISYKIAATISSHLNAKKAKKGVFHLNLLEFGFVYLFYCRTNLIYWVDVDQFLVHCSKGKAILNEKLFNVYSLY